MNQKNLFVEIEKNFHINKPIFLNAENWYDTNLCFAKDLTNGSIGRYRINPDFSNNKITEFWFDIESSSYDEAGSKIKILTKEIVKKRFPLLKEKLMQLAVVILPYFNNKNRLYVRASGSGLHLFFFVENLTQEQWLNLTRYFIDKSKLKNTKNSASLVYGIDVDAVISVKRKIRETYSSNIDKIKLNKVDYTNYCSCFTLNEFLELDEYPFCEAIEDIKTPKKYLSFKLPKNLSDISLSYTPKTESTIEKRKTDITTKTIIYSKIPKNLKGIAKELSKCPAYWSMLKKENADWYERNFLVKWLKYGMKLNEQQILWLIDKYCGWSDYDSKITAYYVHKHCIEGTAETKFKAPVRKKVLMKYGNCKNDCEECVYYDRFFG